MEQELANRVEAQRRLQEEALAAVSAEAARAAELAAAAAVRAAAADAIREAANAAEQEEFKRKAQQLKVHIIYLETGQICINRRKECFPAPRHVLLCVFTLLCSILLTRCGSV